MNIEKDHAVALNKCPGGNQNPHVHGTFITDPFSIVQQFIGISAFSIMKNKVFALLFGSAEKVKSLI